MFRKASPLSTELMSLWRFPVTYLSSPQWNLFGFQPALKYTCHFEHMRLGKFLEVGDFMWVYNLIGIAISVIAPTMVKMLPSWLNNMSSVYSWGNVLTCPPGGSARSSRSPAAPQGETRVGSLITTWLLPSWNSVLGFMAGSLHCHSKTSGWECKGWGSPERSLRISSPSHGFSTTRS